jgi:hypothetical protein
MTHAEHQIQRRQYQKQRQQQKQERQQHLSIAPASELPSELPEKQQQSKHNLIAEKSQLSMDNCDQ